MSIKPLSETLYNTVHRSKKPAKVLADETGISYNYLARMSMDTSSGVSFNLKFLVPLMKAAGNYEILKTLNQLCGYLPPVRPPRGWKKSPKQEVHQYQQAFNQLIGLLLAFVDAPSQELLSALNESMQSHMAATEAMRQRCLSQTINQGELFDEEEAYNI